MADESLLGVNEEETSTLGLATKSEPRFPIPDAMDYQDLDIPNQVKADDALTFDPEKTAEVTNASNDLKINPAVVVGNKESEELILNKYKSVNLNDKLEYIQQNHPKLYEVMGTQALRIAYDDLDTLMRLDEHLQEIGMPEINPFIQGRNLHELAQIANKAKVHGWASLTIDENTRYLELKNNISAHYETVGATEYIVTESMRLAGTMYDLIVSPETAIAASTGAAAGAYITRTPHGFFGGLGWGFNVGMGVGTFQLESGLAFEEFSEERDAYGKQMEHDLARHSANVVGTVNALVEVVSLRVLGKITGMDKFANKFSKKTLKEQLKRNPALKAKIIAFGKAFALIEVSETGTELLQEFFTSLGGKILKENLSEGVGYEETTWGDIIDRMAETAVAVTAGVFPLAIGGGVVSNISNNAAQRRLENEKFKFKLINDESARSKLNERDKKQFQALLESLAKEGPLETVYLDVDGAIKFFQENNISIDEFIELVPSLEEDSFNNNPGGNVEIPTSEWATYVAGEAYANGLGNDIKFNPHDEMTTNEWEAYKKTPEYEALETADPDEVNRILEQYNREEQFSEESAGVHELIIEQLLATGRYPTREEARVTAAIPTALITAGAKRVGQDPMSIYESIGLKIVGPLVKSLEKGSVDLFDSAVDKIRKGLIPTESEAYGRTALEYLGDIGGIMDDGSGEFEDLRETKWHRETGTKRRKVLRDDGKHTPDSAAEALMEAGYMDEDYTPNKLYDIIERELGGEPTYVGLEDSKKLNERLDLLKLSEVLDQAGIDLEEITDNKQIKNIIEQYLGERTNEEIADDWRELTQAMRNVGVNFRIRRDAEEAATPTTPTNIFEEELGEAYQEYTGPAFRYVEQNLQPGEEAASLRLSGFSAGLEEPDVHTAADVIRFEYNREDLTSEDLHDVVTNPKLMDALEKLPPQAVVYVARSREVFEEEYPFWFDPEDSQVKPLPMENVYDVTDATQGGIILEDRDDGTFIINPLYKEALGELQQVLYQGESKEYSKSNDYDKVKGQERKAIDELIDRMDEPEKVRQRLREHKGTPWVRATIEGLKARAAIETLVKGKKPKFRSTLTAESGVNIYKAILNGGEEAIWEYLAARTFIGHPEKPLNAVNSSFINCNPSRDCAIYCYAAKGRNYAAGVNKAELITWAIENDPVRAARITANQYKAMPEFELERALRLFDKGDGDMKWIPYIEEMNRHGVRLHIFSKNPEFLRAVSDYNVRLLSIDVSNHHMADLNPDLPIAYVYTNKSEVQWLEAHKDNIQLILPIKQGATILDKENINALPKWAKPFICPIDKGVKKLGDWNCTKCDRRGGIGCYHKQTTERVNQLGNVPLGELVKDEAKLKQVLEDIQDVTKDLNEQESEILHEELDELIARARAGFDQRANGTVNERVVPTAQDDGTGREQTDGDGGKKTLYQSELPTQTGEAKTLVESKENKVFEFSAIKLLEEFGPIKNTPEQWLSFFSPEKSSQRGQKYAVKKDVNDSLKLKDFFNEVEKDKKGHVHKDKVMAYLNSEVAHIRVKVISEERPAILHGNPADTIETSSVNFYNGGTIGTDANNFGAQVSNKHSDGSYRTMPVVLDFTSPREYLRPNESQYTAEVRNLSNFLDTSGNSAEMSNTDQDDPGVTELGGFQYSNKNGYVKLISLVGRSYDILKEAYANEGNTLPKKAMLMGDPLDYKAHPYLDHPPDAASAFDDAFYLYLKEHLMSLSPQDLLAWAYFGAHHSNIKVPEAMLDRLFNIGGYFDLDLGTMPDRVQRIKGKMGLIPEEDVRYGSNDQMNFDELMNLEPDDNARDGVHYKPDDINNIGKLIVNQWTDRGRSSNPTREGVADFLERRQGPLHSDEMDFFTARAALYMEYIRDAGEGASADEMRQSAEETKEKLLNVPDIETFISEMTNAEKEDIVNQLLERKVSGESGITYPDTDVPEEMPPHEHLQEFTRVNNELGGEPASKFAFAFLGRGASSKVTTYGLHRGDRFDLIFTEYVKLWHSFASDIVNNHELPKTFNLKIIPLDQIVNDRGQLQLPVSVNKNYKASTSSGGILGTAPLLMEFETVHVNPSFIFDDLTDNGDQQGAYEHSLGRHGNNPYSDMEGSWLQKQYLKHHTKFNKIIYIGEVSKAFKKMNENEDLASQLRGYILTRETHKFYNILKDFADAHGAAIAPDVTPGGILDYLIDLDDFGVHTVLAHDADAVAGYVVELINIINQVHSTPNTFNTDLTTVELTEGEDLRLQIEEPGMNVIIDETNEYKTYPFKKVSDIFEDVADNNTYARYSQQVEDIDGDAVFSMDINSFVEESNGLQGEKYLDAAQQASIQNDLLLVLEPSDGDNSIESRQARVSLEDIRRISSEFFTIEPDLMSGRAHDQFTSDGDFVRYWNVLLTAPDFPADFVQQVHYNPKNVFVFARLTERTDPETGEKILFIEEIQSDWHQGYTADEYRPDYSSSGLRKGSLAYTHLTDLITKLDHMIDIREQAHLLDSGRLDQSFESVMDPKWRPGVPKKTEAVEMFNNKLEQLKSRVEDVEEEIQPMFSIFHEDRIGLDAGPLPTAMRALAPQQLQMKDNPLSTLFKREEDAEQYLKIFLDVKKEVVEKLNAELKKDVENAFKMPLSIGGEEFNSSTAIDKEYLEIQDNPFHDFKGMFEYISGFHTGNVAEIHQRHIERFKVNVRERLLMWTRGELEHKPFGDEEVSQDYLDRIVAAQPAFFKFNAQNIKVKIDNAKTRAYVKKFAADSLPVIEIDETEYEYSTLDMLSNLGTMSFDDFLDQGGTFTFDDVTIDIDLSDHLTGRDKFMGFMVKAKDPKVSKLTHRDFLYTDSEYAEMGSKKPFPNKLEQLDRNVDSEGTPVGEPHMKGMGGSISPDTETARGQDTEEFIQQAGWDSPLDPVNNSFPVFGKAWMDLMEGGFLGADLGFADFGRNQYGEVEQLELDFEKMTRLRHPYSKEGLQHWVMDLEIARRDELKLEQLSDLYHETFPDEPLQDGKTLFEIVSHTENIKKIEKEFKIDLRKLTYPTKKQDEARIKKIQEEPLRSMYDPAPDTKPSPVIMTGRRPTANIEAQLSFYKLEAESMNVLVQAMDRLDKKSRERGAFDSANTRPEPVNPMLVDTLTEKQLGEIQKLRDIIKASTLWEGVLDVGKTKNADKPVKPPFRNQWKIMMFKYLLTELVAGGYDKIVLQNAFQALMMWKSTIEASSVRIVKEVEKQDVETFLNYLSNTDKASWNEFASVKSKDRKKIKYKIYVNNSDEPESLVVGNQTRIWEEGKLEGETAARRFLGDEVYDEAVAHFKKIGEESTEEFTKSGEFRFGAAGRTKLYDTLFPKEFDKYLQSLKIPKGKLEHHKFLERSYEKIRQQFSTEVAQELHDLLGKEAVEELTLPPGHPTKATMNWTVDVTEELREEIKKGQTLFQAPILEKEQDKKRGSIEIPKEGLGSEDVIINLFQAADLSTFLHESGHLSLELMRYLVAQEGAPQDLLDDWEAVKEFLGIESDEAEITTDQHEMWAESFEKYLYEGKAPSLALQSHFDTIRSWLVAVYKGLKRTIGYTDAELNDEIRSVMDRMIASKEEIEVANSKLGQKPLIGDKDILDMTDLEWEKYLRAIQNATGEGERQLQAKMLREVRREQEAQYKAKRNEVKEEVTAAINERPVYRAIQFLKYGKHFDGSQVIEPFKLSKQGILEVLDGSTEMLKRLPGRGKTGIYRIEGGIHPDEAAAVFGYKSGREMLLDIINSPTREEVIENVTDQEMEALYPTMMRDGTVERHAMEAVHNDARARYLEAELKALQKRASTPFTPAAVAKQTAKDIIARSTFKQIRAVNKYLNAERRAGKLAEQALAQENYAEAARQKRIQLINHHLFNEASKVVNEVDKARTYLSKFSKKSIRKNIDPDYLDQIDELLIRFDVRKTHTKKRREERQSLREFIQEQQELGLNPSIDPEMANTAFTRHYSEVPLEELFGLLAGIKSLEHVGRLKKRLLTSERNAMFEEIFAEMERQLESHADYKPDQKLEVTDGVKKVVKGAMDDATGSHIKIEGLLDYLDGGAAKGIFWESIFKPMADADESEQKIMAEFAEKFNEILKTYTRKELKNFKKWKYRDEIGTKLSHNQILGIALNWGNEGNRIALLNAEAYQGWNWTADSIQALLDNHLTEKDAEAVQAIWDMIDGLWPEISKLEREMTGTVPEKIDPIPLTIAGVDLKGGYYPLKYDPAHSARQAALGEKKAAESLIAGQFASTATKKGHTKERIGSGGGAPVLEMDSVLAGHVRDVVHDLTHRRAIIDVMRIIQDKTFRRLLENTAGSKFHTELRTWLRDIAKPEFHLPVGLLEKIVSHFKQGTTIVSLGLKFTTALIQPLGYTQSIELIGYKYAVKEFARWFANPVAWKKDWEFVSKNSVMMTNRATNMDRDMRDAMLKLTGTGRQKSFARHYFALIAMMDMYVSIPTWLAAYRKAMDGNAKGIEKGDHESAIRYGDKAVRMSQSSGSVKDLARIQRGAPMHQSFTMFYSYFSAFHTLMWRRKKLSGHLTLKSGMELTNSLILLAFIPAVLGPYILGQNDEDEGFLEAAIKNSIAYPFLGIVGLRDIVNYFRTDYGYSGTPVAGTMEALLYSITAASDAVTNMLPFAEEDPEWTRADWKNTVVSAGAIFKWPTRQLWMSGEYLWDWMQDDLDGDFNLYEFLLTGDKEK